MACITKSQRLQDIFDMARAATNKEDLNINTFQDLESWFKQNFPNVTSEELEQSFIPTTDIRKGELKSALKASQERLRRFTTAVDRLNEILVNKSNEKIQEDISNNKGKVVPPGEVDEINKLLSDIHRMAGIDVSIPPEAYTDIITRIKKLEMLNYAYFDVNGSKVAESHVKRAIEQLNMIKRAAKTSEINQKIKDIDDQIMGLDKEEIDYSDIGEIDAVVRFKGLDEVIAKKNIELAEKRVDLELALKRAKRKERAKKGIAGFKGKGAQKTVELALLFKDSAWEPFRALKFMGDISAFGVQGNPVVLSMLTDIDVKAALSGQNPFTSQLALARIFRDTTWGIVANAKVDWRLRRNEGTYAQQLLNDLRGLPSFNTAVKAGLHISEIGSITNSEEVFTSRMLNRVWGFGAVKDLSEESMVSTLNALRMNKFDKFYQATGGALSIEEYARAAEFINKMTGTTNDPELVGLAHGLKYLYSAPKLFLSRLKLATWEVAKTPGRLDVPSSIRKGSFQFNSEADAFMFKEMMKTVRGYVALGALLAMVGVDFEWDPRELDFLRARLGQDGEISVDPTGGIGSIWRTILKAVYLTTGPPPGASFTTQDKLNFMKERINENAFDALMTGFVRYKLHPTINGGYQAITGKDFFGETYSVLTDITGAPKESVVPHIEGMARAMLPISIEQLVDDASEVYDGDIKSGSAAVAEVLQFMGHNAFVYDTEMQSPDIINLQDELGVRVNKNIRYPRRLNAKKDNRTKKYLKNEFKDLYENILGDSIKARGANPDVLNERDLKTLSRQALRDANEQFMDKYGDELDKLEDAPRKK